MTKDTKPARKTAKKPKAAKSPPGGRSSERTEQQRSIDTRLSILNAALLEFGEKGFDAASMRSIGERSGLHFTLITYHFRNKETLWEATLEHFFEEISERWWKEVGPLDQSSPVDLVRNQFRSFMNFTVDFPHFHHMMIHENQVDNPRLDWVIKFLVKPIMDTTIPNIMKSQREGQLPNVDPMLLHYLLVGCTTALSSLGEEIKYNSKLDPSDPRVVEEYWNIIDQIVFRRPAPTPAE